MKRYFSNLLTIIISCMLIACTVFFTTFDGFENKVRSVEENVSAKISVNDIVNVNRVNTKNILEKMKSDDGQADGVKNQTTPSKTTTAASATMTTKKTTTTKEKTTVTTTEKVTAPSVPADESRNIDFIKDPDYKSKYYIVVYTGSQSTVVYGKDKTGAYNVIVKAFTVSTGKKSTPTRKGIYKIRAKYRWRLLMGPCWGQYCSSISSSYLFHSVPYDKKSANTLYNASYNNLGKAVSHGCIRMCVRDVKWIYDNCPIGTQVHIVWESGPKGAGVPKRKSGAKYSGWDPSDKWAEGNPYFSDSEKTEKTTETTESPTKSTEKKDTTNSSSVPSSTKSTKEASTSQTSASATTPSVSSSMDANESSDDFDGVPVG